MPKTKDELPNMIYTKYQAFNAVYKELTNEPNTGGADFDVPKKYHHAPKN